MSDRFFAATRKGLFTFEREPAAGPRGWQLRRVAFLGDPVSVLLHDGADGQLYAALALGHFGVKLKRSSDEGKSWEECEAPAYPPQPEGVDPSTPWSTSLIWSLESAGHDRAGCLWAGTIPGGLFRSGDRGASWELVRSLWDRPERGEWAGGGYDHPGIHSICVDPRDTRRVTLGVSIGGVWATDDGAESWECRAAGMRADYVPPEVSGDPNLQDPHRVVQCPASPDVLWAQHHNGVWRSTDRAASWQEVKTLQPSNFGFAVAVHPRDGDTAWFVPAVKDECRVPVDGKLVVSRTTDGGQSFQVQRDGLPQEHVYDLVYRHCLDVDSSGERLVMASTSGGLWVSESQGESWTCLSTHLPPVNCVRFAT